MDVLIYAATTVVAFLAGMLVHWWLTRDERRLLRDYEHHNAQTEALNQKRVQLGVQAQQLRRRRRR